MGTSTFAEATVMPEIALAKVSPEAPLDRACLFACGLSTGLGAAMNTAKVEPGSTCVVFGAGTVERIVELTGGLGADYTFEATGNVAVMRQAVESARMGWGLATVCGVAGKCETLEVVPRFLITGRRVAGSSFGGVKGRDQVPQLVERWLAGEIDVEPFVSHKLTLDEVNRGFELMEAKDGIRSVIDLG